MEMLTTMYTLMGVALLSVAIATPAISFNALETILNLDVRITVASLKENSTPVYRKDMPFDLVAYWQVVVNDNDFVIVSAGPETGDHRLIYEGPLPTYTSRLDLHSEGRCARYFMLTPSGAIMCEDAHGHVLATTHYQLLNIGTVEAGTIIGDDEDGDTQGRGFVGPKIGADGALDSFVQSSMDMMEMEFTKRRDDVSKSMVWIDDVLSSPVSVELGIGDRVKLPVVSESSVVAEGGSTQDVVCAVTGLCDGRNTTVLHDAYKTENGIKHVNIAVKRIESASIESASFRIVIKQDSGDVTQHYVTRKSRRRSRRQLRQATSNWTYYSIPHEDLFPDYHQFDYQGCAVGCGPVAWASVFAYLDRLAHGHSSYPSQYKQLYRNSSDGTSGSADEVAPSRLDTRMKAYIRNLNDILGTFCLFGDGATVPAGMAKASSFYMSRVSGGHIEVKHHPGIWSIIVFYDVKYSIDAVEYIKRGFPVILGWMKGGSMFAQHYPIVTRYRSRGYNQCTGGVSNCTWVTTERQFYYHMGWGGADNGWKAAEAYMTSTALYP